MAINSDSGRPAIAVVGIGCRFPGSASSPGALWRLLESGVDAIGDVPAGRWDVERYYSPRTPHRGRMNARRGGFLENADLFDPSFFGISQRVADQMDPQQRILLEVCWEALEDAGIAADRLSGSRTGVFVGASGMNYAELQTAPGELEGIGAHSATGVYMSILANRLSYQLDLHGPSITVDTACSSSLVAAHLANRSLRAGECDLALVAGVNLMLAPHGGVMLSQASMLSPDGQSRAFDSTANGYVRGEGAGVIVLKPLDVAVRSGDHVYAVIRGSAVNQDGRTPGITVPNGRAQVDNFRAALADAGIPARDVGYVEAHGTGTPVGDPIEANALGEVLKTDRPTGRVAFLGSVKTNIGHLEAAAGAVGLVKAALALHHRRIPPNLHFTTPNPEIDLIGARLAVPTEPEPWPDGYPSAIASVNSFGFGGTNANVVLSEAPAPVAGRERADDNGTTGSIPAVLTISARNEQALGQLVAEHANRLDDPMVDLELTAANLAVRRSHGDHRVAVVATSRSEAARLLREHAAGRDAASLHTGRARPSRGRLAMVFNGQGPQWFAMGRTLLTSSVVFRDKIAECDELARPHLGWSIMAGLKAPDEASSTVDQTSCMQPMMFALQVALVELWKSWGIVPDAVVGHSLGEIAAAHVSGALDLATALRVVCLRARVQEWADPSGGMLFVALDQQRAQDLCARHPGEAWLSAHNSPGTSTLSGRRSALALIADKLSRDGVFARLLKVNCACHSPDMDPLREELFASLAEVGCADTGIPMYSTVTGNRIDGRVLDTAYWWRNFREPVRFHAACQAMSADGVDTFVEVGPHPVMRNAINEIAAAEGHEAIVVPSLRRDKDDWETFLGSLADLYVTGRPIAWDVRYPHPVPRLELPGNPWSHVRCWNESETSLRYRSGGQWHPMLKRVDATRPTWEIKWDDHRLAWVSQHDVFSSVLVPGAAYVEAAWAASQEETSESCTLEFIEFERACVLQDSEPMVSRIELDTQQRTFEVHSRSLRGATWHRNARGRYLPAAETGEGVREVDLDALRARLPHAYGPADVYGPLKRLGYAYGPLFSGIARLHLGDGEALAMVRLPHRSGNRFEDYLFHPALLDACFQTGILQSDPESGGVRPFACLPVGIEKARLYRNATGTVWCHMRLRAIDNGGMLGDAQVYDQSGRLVAQFTGLRTKAVPHAAADEDGISRHYYGFDWKRDDTAAAASVVGTALRSRPSDVLPALQPEIDGLSRELDRTVYLTSYHTAVRELCTAYAAECMDRLGADLKAGAEFDVGMLAVHPDRRQVLAVLLRALVEDGVLTPPGDTGRYRVLRQVDEPAASRWSAALAEHPGCAGELHLLHCTGERLHEVVAGLVDPVELLFPEGSPAEVEAVYHSSPISRWYNLAARMVVERLVADADPRRTLRILEVGSGSGGLTAHILPILPADRCEYTFTDLSAAFLASARERFRDYGFVDYQTFDLDQDVHYQDLPLAGYDLILASDAVHAATDLKGTLLGLHELLRPGGAIAMIEASPQNRWLELTFGLLESWWHFRDRNIRTVTPLLTVSSWNELLRSSGFGGVVALSDADPDAPGTQSLLLATALAGERAEAEPTTGRRIPAAEPAEVGEWLILNDDAGLGAALADRIEDAGGHAVRVDPRIVRDADDPAPEATVDYAELLDGRDVRGIVFVWDEQEPEEEYEGWWLERTSESWCTELSDLLRALRHMTPKTWPRLYIITRGAQGIRNDDIRLVGASAWGFGLTVGVEFPEIRCRLIDVEAATDGDADAVWAELLRTDDHGEVVLRGGERFVRRLSPLSPGALRSPVDTGDLGADEAFAAEVTTPGLLDGIGFRASRREVPGPGQVQVEVRSAGLNFLDVMTTLGQVPPLERAAERLIGADCAGVVTEVGEGVTEVAAGDAVLALSDVQGTVASHITVDARAVVPMPRNLGFDDAATIPVAFVTASIALHRLARIQPGDRVLIHSASGGTGLAAVQLAILAGAEVFATAGTERKREFLRALGVTHVLDSRSAAFADEVRAATSGRGVDVVLGAVTGDQAIRSIGCLASYGRYVDIGKRDQLDDRRLGLRPFLNNLSYFGFDLRQMLSDRPCLVRDELRSLVTRFEEGKLHPLPHRIYYPGETVAALRQLAASHHVGKLVISMSDPDVRVRPRLDRQTTRIRGTWLVTGGLGGVGLAMAASLAEAGAEGLVLIGRSGVSRPEAQAALERLRSRGVKVLAKAVDVTCRDQLADLLGTIEAECPPLRGVLHCAMVLDDALVTNLDRPRFARVLAPKLLGAYHLHELTANHPLDAFVLFSSATSMLGSVGQANYAAANAFLDHLAEYRQAQGRPALAVNWGAVSGVGFVARHGDVGERVSDAGLLEMTPGQMHEAMTAFLDGGRPRVGVIPIDWTRFLQRSGVAGPIPPRYERVVAPTDREAGDGDGEIRAGSLRSRLFACTGPRRQALLKGSLLDAVGRILGIPRDQIDEERSLLDYLDSLLAVEITAWIQRDTGVKLTLMELIGTPTSVNDLTAKIIGQLGDGTANGANHEGSEE